MKPAILFVSYYYHPQMLTATRNYYLSKMLADQGYEVHVLSIESIAQQNLAPEHVHYHPVKAWDYRRVLKLLRFQDGITSTKIKSEKFIEWGHQLLLKYPFNFILGEGGGLYYRKAIIRGKSLIRQYPIQYIYSSYRPITDHGIASHLKVSFPQIKWIGDFRDVLWWTRADHHYQQSWIRKMIYSMDYITAVTKGIADFWSSVYKKPVLTLYNGLPEVNIHPSNPDRWQNKFVINYTGRIYTYFQRADIFFLAIRELIHEVPEFARDILIHYAGINKLHWQAWLDEFGLKDYALVLDHQPVEYAWHCQARAQINLLLTWTTPDVTGFIHGKYNEYLAARNPILCIVEGKPDIELEELYRPLTNCLIITNEATNESRLKEYIMTLYRQWKSGGEPYLMQAEWLKPYAWARVGQPLLEILES